MTSESELDLTERTRVEPQSIVLVIERPSIFVRLVRRIRDTVRGVWWRQRLGGFGAGSVLDPPAWVVGGRSIVIGQGVQIWHNARLEAFNTGVGVERLVIGEGTVVQPFVHIGAAQSVRIGKKCGIGSHVFITDHDHDFSVTDKPVIFNRRLIVSPVCIGDEVWLGDQVIVLKGVHIGDGAIVGAGSIVTRDIPSRCIAVGSPARVVKRWDARSESWVRAEDA